MSIDLRITGGLAIQHGRVITSDEPAAIEIDAGGLDVIPGLIDIHGDAFERALAPRANAMMPLAIAMAAFEAQLLACGITTAFLAVTLSWEAGLRSRATYEMLRDYVRARPAGGVPDLKLHIRFEAHNLACLDLAEADIAAGCVAMLSFNDHAPGIMERLHDPAATAKYADRAGQSIAGFTADLKAACAAAPDAVAAGRSRLAAVARAAGVPMASHDDANVAQRDYFNRIGVDICEFPMTSEVAQAARAQNSAVVMGAPNVVRGGSHMGWHGAEAMVRQGLCDVLCSDYHGPSMLPAAYRIARNGSASFADAMNLVTRNPARAARLPDRGTLAAGSRADLVLADPGGAGQPPRAVITIADGKLAYLAPGALDRFKINPASRAPAAARQPSFTMTRSA